MELIRTPEEIRISLKYKISKRKVNNKSGVSYQYLVRVPPLLCSFFNFTDYKEYNPNSLCFYEYENKFFIVDPESYINIGNSKINMKIKDNSVYRAEFMAVNKVPNNKGFQVTLPLTMFKQYLNPYETQYIKYTLHTGKEDIAYNKGLCEIEIIKQ